MFGLGWNRYKKPVVQRRENGIDLDLTFAYTTTFALNSVIRCAVHLPSFFQPVTSI
jgi:hypothetical protein